MARLNYATEKLDLNLTLDEPAGGILRASANIPGRPPVKLNVAGTGTLDAFGATLAFNAGERSERPVRQIFGDRERCGGFVLDLDAQVEGLLPGVAAPVFAGTTQLDGETIFGDDGTITIPQLSVVSKTARLDAVGSMDANKSVDLRLVCPRRSDRSAKNGCGRRGDQDACLHRHGERPSVGADCRR